MESSSEEGEIKYNKTTKYSDSKFNYSIKEKIGEGTFGKVYLSYHNNKSYALKQIPTDLPNGLSITTIREIKILKKLKHKNIIEIIEVACKNNEETFNRNTIDLYIVFPYYEYDLYTLIKRKQLTKSEIRFIGVQLCEGLAFIHKKNFIHRDFKSANILLSHSLELKICDFGLTRHHDNGALTPGIVTLWYRAPELILGSYYYDKSIDVWGLGCIFGELLMGHPLMTGSNEIEQLEMIVYLCGSINEHTFQNVEKLPNYKKIVIPQGRNNIKMVFDKFDSDIVELIYRCMNVDPLKRIEMAKIFDLPFFDSENKVKKRKM